MFHSVLLFGIIMGQYIYFGFDLFDVSQERIHRGVLFFHIYGLCTFISGIFVEVGHKLYIYSNAILYISMFKSRILCGKFDVAKLFYLFTLFIIIIILWSS